MEITSIIKNQVQSELNEQLLKIINDSIDKGIKYIQKALLAKIRSEIGYEICLSDPDDKLIMYKVLQRIDPVQYAKYCVLTREDRSDIMVTPLRNGMTYVATAKPGLNTWIMVSTRNWDMNSTEYANADELNLFVFGMYAKETYEMLVTRLQPIQIDLTPKEKSEPTKTMKIVTYRLYADKNKESGYLENQGTKIVKGLDQIFTDRKPVEECIKYIQKWSTATKFFEDKGITHKLGILLYGPPGTGKTSLAQALAGYFHRPLVTWNPGDFCAATVNRIKNHGFKDIFFLLLEDIDYIFGDRKDDQSTEEKERFNLLLQFLDGVHSVPNAVVIATTNDYESFEEAVVRDGRFDFKIYMGNIDEPVANKMIEELNISTIPVDMSNEEYPINPAYVQNKTITHVFNHLNDIQIPDAKITDGITPYEFLFADD